MIINLKTSKNKQDDQNIRTKKSGNLVKNDKLEIVWEYEPSADANSRISKVFKILLEKELLKIKER